MSNKTNDEKLRILQERLAQIKEKQETPVPSSKQQEKVIEITTPEFETPAKDKKPLYSGRWSKVILIGVVAYGIFYGYNNIDFKLFLPDLSSEEVTEKSVPVELKYSFNLEGDQLAIIGEFEDEGSAKAMANGLKVKGYKCNYFYLPNKSNSTKEIYKVFIGPYENDDETSQWTKNLETEFEIVQL